MKPVYQTRFGGPEDPVEEQGNCFAAALASLTEVPRKSLPQVPYAVGHFDTWDEFLASAWGVALVWIDVIDEDEPITGTYLMAVDSGRFPESAHVVVVQDWRVIHDPDRTNGPPYTFRQAGILYPLDPVIGGARSVERKARRSQNAKPMEESHSRPR